MRNQILTVLVILVLSSAAAVVAKSTWYDKDMELPWIRTPPPAPTQTDHSDTSNHGKTDQLPAPKPGTILIDQVLDDLANGSAVFVDAREPHEFVEGRLRGVIHIPSSAIYDNIDNLYAQGVGSDDKIIVYCGGGECEASHNVADALRGEFNFTHVLVYENGWAEIESSGRFDAYIERGGEE
ncbi:MAG: rhodanese-like domain-containing protein [Phycisphaerae bacterium]